MCVWADDLTPTLRKVVLKTDLCSIATRAGDGGLGEAPLSDSKTSITRRFLLRCRLIAFPLLCCHLGRKFNFQTLAMHHHHSSVKFVVYITDFRRSSSVFSTPDSIKISCAVNNDLILHLPLLLVRHHNLYTVVVVLGHQPRTPKHSQNKLAVKFIKRCNILFLITSLSRERKEGGERVCVWVCPGSSFITISPFISFKGADPLQ